MVDVYLDVVEHVCMGVTFTKVDGSLLAGRLRLQRVALGQCGGRSPGMLEFVRKVRDYCSYHEI